ncbi:response regulator transcription factor [uncultured Alsobacter sp.]|uniref:response regulator n=1 Tax=uncultured Alsobacter sp. TaxID=1748258 RepID=UPI0025EE475B|nr:response regulator transcription factor [uncultured Alsobacter sp.]
MSVETVTARPAGAHPITVLVVDDHPLIREGIAALLAQEPDLRLVGEAANGDQALALHRALRPQVTLMDLQMPGAGGLEAIEAIRAESPAARIIVLTTYGGDLLARRALKAGAQAYLLKSSVRKDLMDTIRAVHRGQTRVSSDVACAMAGAIGAEDLSPREQQVLQLIAAGNSNKAVAGLLGLAEETVKGHVKNILVKLGARDRTHAVALGMARGLLDPYAPS